MTVIPVSALQNNAIKYVKHAIDTQEVISVTTDNGNAVLINESDYKNLVETLYLLRDRELTERIAEARNTPITEGEDFEW